MINIVVAYANIIDIPYITMRLKAVRVKYQC